MLASSAMALTALSRMPARPQMNLSNMTAWAKPSWCVGQVSSSELVEAAIARIEKINPVLNAVVHKLYDEGRAATAHCRTAHSQAPYLIKDLSELEGAPLTYGSKLFEHNVAETDNGSVEQAKQAGLVIIGKSNTPEFGFIPTAESQLLGVAAIPITPPIIRVAVREERAAVAPGSYPLPMPQTAVGQSAFRLR